MMRATRSLVCVVMVSAAAATVPAVVQAQPARETTAAIAFRQGAAAMQANRCEEAIGYFSESYRLAPASNTLYNIAHCHRELGHTRLAVTFYEQYLNEAGDEVAPAREQALQQLIVELRARLAIVRLRVQPFDATVVVDGNRVRLVRSEALLDPGPHSFALSSPGFVTDRRSLDLRPGDRVDLDVVLVRDVPPDVPAATRVEPPAPAPATAAPVATPHPPGEAPSQQTSSPLYTRWWFWTGIGVVVAGGVAAAVIALSGTADPTPADLHFETLRVR